MSGCKNIKLAKKWKKAEQLLFINYLKLLLENGFSLNKALELLPNIWPEKQKDLQQVNQLLAANKSLQEILLQLGFSQTIATQIMMALNQGTLTVCLAQLGQIMQLRAKQQRKIKQELAYPLVIVSLMIALLIFMKGFLQQYLPQTRASLPELVIYLFLAGLSGVLILAAIYCAYALKQQSYRQLKVISNWPFIGKTVKLYVQYLMLFNLEILVANGFSINQICDFTTQLSSHSLQRQLGALVQQKLTQGEQLTKIIDSENFLARELVLIISTGSEHREIARQINVLELLTYHKLENNLQKISLKIQPLCFLGIGLGIISIYAKLLLPVYQMMQTL